GLGHSLYAKGRAVLTDFWSGLKSIGGAILGWIGDFASSIWDKGKSFFRIGSPSRLFYDIGKNLMLGLFHGIKDHAHLPSAAMGGAAGGSVAALGKRMAASYGWTGAEWAALNAVAMRESGWSLTARNPSSGAYGVAQFINGPSEYYQYGGNPNTAAGQITGFLNYVRQRYGSPSAAWAHELQFGWYGRGLQGGIFNRPTLIGVGESGPERVDVTPLGQGRGGAAVQFGDIHGYNENDMAMVRQKLSAAVVMAGLGSWP